MNDTPERDALLTAYLAGELDRAGTDKVRERLASSPDWQAALAALQPGWEQCQKLVPPPGGPRALSAARQAAVLRAASEPLPAAEPPALAASPDGASPTDAQVAAPAATPTEVPPVMSKSTAPGDAPPSPHSGAGRPWQMWIQAGAAAAVLITLLVVWLNTPPPSAGPMASHQPAATPPAPGTAAPMAAPAELAADAAPAKAGELAKEEDAAEGLATAEAAKATPPAAPPIASDAMIAQDGGARRAFNTITPAPAPPMAPLAESPQRKLAGPAESMAREAAPQLGGAAASDGAALPKPGAAAMAKRHELAAAKAVEVTPAAGAATPFGALMDAAPEAATPAAAEMLLPLPQAPLAPELWQRVQHTLLAGEAVAPADLEGPWLTAHLVQLGIPTGPAPMVTLELYGPADDTRVARLLMAARAPVHSVDEPWLKLTEAATKAANAKKLAMTNAVLSLAFSPLVEAWRLPGGEWQKPATEYRTPSTQHHHNDAASQVIELKLVPEADGRVATFSWQWQEPGLTQLKQMAAEVRAPITDKPGRLTRLYELADNFTRQLMEHGGRLPASETGALRQQWRPLDRSRTVHDQVLVDQLGRLLMREADAPKAATEP